MKSAVDNHLSEFTSMEANTRHTYAQITTKMMNNNNNNNNNENNDNSNNDKIAMPYFLRNTRLLQAAKTRA